MRRARVWSSLVGCVACALIGAPVALAGGPHATATRVGAVSASQQIEIVLPLSADYAGLRRWALDVSTPRSEHYGAYESIAQLSRRFGASARARKRVVSFLHRAGATRVSIDATGLFADATL